jgi:putative N6-adenine-specific DNA methylase
MCGSGTFAIEAALIAANINPGVFRRGFAFEHWQDFDAELFDRLYNDDSQEREVKFPIIGGDISPVAVEIARRNVKGAGVAKYVDIQVKPLSTWEEAPVPAGYIVTNPPYGERISAPDMDALYELIGSKLKRIFPGWQAWIIGYREEYFQKIGLAPSEKVSLLNGSLDCELRQYILFTGNKRDFRAAGGKLKTEKSFDKKPAARKPGDRKPFKKDGKPFDRDRKPFGKDGKPFDRDAKPSRFERKDERAAETASSSDNPLAKRRNPDALKSITGRTPQLPPSQGPIMRSRGWKKK